MGVGGSRKSFEAPVTWNIVKNRNRNSLHRRRPKLVSQTSESSKIFPYRFTSRHHRVYNMREGSICRPASVQSTLNFSSDLLRSYYFPAGDDEPPMPNDEKPIHPVPRLLQLSHLSSHINTRENSNNRSDLVDYLLCDKRPPIALVACF